MLATIMLVSYVSYNLNTLDSSEVGALYGGQSNSGSHPYAGYIVNYSNFFTPQNCGMVQIESDRALSAAHCLEEGNIYYLGTGILEKNLASNAAISEYVFHPQWDPNTLLNDLAVIRYESDDVELHAGKYAQIGDVTPGCDYEVVAYGSTDEKVLHKSDLRRSADVCVRDVSNGRFTFVPSQAGICFGDSGSPIFRKDTNEVVGIVSAITSAGSDNIKDNCYMANTAIGISLSAYRDFIYGNPDIAEVSTCGQNSQTCANGELCRSNECVEPGDLLLATSVDTTGISAVLSGGFLNIAVLLSGILIPVVGYKVVKEVREFLS